MGIPSFKSSSAAAEVISLDGRSAGRRARPRDAVSRLCGASFHDAPRNSASPNSEMRRWRRIGDASPWIPIFLRAKRGWGLSLYRLVTPCLADTPRRDDRPPTHFFVKKKFIPSGGVGSITHAGGSFFLYEKSVLRESDYLRGRRKEVCTDLTNPFFRP